MLDGKGVVANGIFYLDADETTEGLPTSTVSAGVPGHPLTTGTKTADLTGAYTATGTPSPSSYATSGRRPPSFGLSIGHLSVIPVGFGLGFLVML
jgi:hypothetical protein